MDSIKDGFRSHRKWSLVESSIQSKEKWEALTRSCKCLRRFPSWVSPGAPSRSGCRVARPPEPFLRGGVRVAPPSSAAAPTSSAASAATSASGSGTAWSWPTAACTFAERSPARTPGDERSNEMVQKRNACVFLNLKWPATWLCWDCMVRGEEWQELCKANWHS